jgi:hypothetical protein
VDTPIRLLNIIAPHLRTGLVAAGLAYAFLAQFVPKVKAVEREKAGEGKHGRHN